MSVADQNAPDTNPCDGRDGVGCVEMLIEPRRRDLGGGVFVGRVLPYAKRRHVGPFVFFDEMGPGELGPGDGMDVRPHPHIGLSTVTWLFDGEMTHRDNLGYEQVIRPGDVNWMTAGRGVVHSERTGDEARARTLKMHGVQTWVALPEDDAETDPEFFHHKAEDLPRVSGEGWSGVLIVGAAYGATSPVKTYSPLFYLAVDAEPGARIALPEDHEERAVYLVDGAASAGDAPIPEQTMAVFEPGGAPTIEVSEPSRLMLLGGAPLGERHIWWNFVSASRDRIEQAKRDWTGAAEASWPENGAFTLPPGETEFIPLPEK
ncbi:MAG: pirin family protein [Pseudomonadota bacterium]